MQVDSSVANAALETLLGDGARGAKAAPRREDCLQRSTSAAGLTDSAVRTWPGWHSWHRGA